VLTTHLITSLVTTAGAQAPVVIQVHNPGGLDLAAVALGALLMLGVLLALAGARLLLTRHTDTNETRRTP
jgi:predicted phage tail protein